MAQSITIWNDAYQSHGAYSASKSVAGFDFVTIFASGISGATAVEFQVSPDNIRFYTSTVSGLHISAGPVAKDLPEKAAYVRLRADASGYYTAYAYAGHYTYHFNG